jgi:toxin ParE1/3/4
MVKYKLTHAALDDISAIWEYTADRWAENQADIYYKMLIMSFEKITIMPTVYGHRYDEIDNKLYGYKAGRHIILVEVYNLCTFRLNEQILFGKFVDNGLHFVVIKTLARVGVELNSEFVVYLVNFL